MANQAPETVATVSLARPLHALAADLGASVERYGFAIVEDHPIAPALIARADVQMRAFFALPDAVKRQYALAGGGGARGYTPFGTEKAKDAQVHDLKEFWHVGRTLPEDSPLAEFMAPNVWPVELDGFEDAFRQLYAAFDETGRRVLAAIALHLGLPAGFFDDTVADGNSVLRLIHYPPVAGDAAQGAVRAAPHGDINTITLLLGAEEAGLELLTRDGRWLPVNPAPGALAINIGDMLERLTNGVLPSTQHRVVNPRGAAAQRSRYSMPFFLHFRPDHVIRTLPECVSEERPDAWPEPLAAHDFLMQRLREIGLVK